MKKAKFFLSLPALLSLSGRMSRLQYFVYSLIYVVLFFAVFVGLGGSGLMPLDAEGDPTGPASVIIYAIVILLFFYGIAGLYAKRLHDLGWPAALLILVLFDIPVDLAVSIAKAYMTVPPVVDTVQGVVDVLGKVASVGIGLFLTFRAGDKGANKYGPDPLKPPAPPIEVF
jgi:uncharacterized membrane protein YhaH (DUF805 family)